MGFRFFRSFGGKFFRFNVGKRGVSITARTALGSINSRGNVSIRTPIKGLRYQTNLNSKQSSKVQHAEAERPFAPSRYPRRKLEQMHIEALQEIERLEMLLAEKG